MDRSKLLKRFKAALRAAGVREIRFHDLRHTFGTRMAAAGVPMRTLQEWMGHRDFKTTLIYADYMPGQREADLVNAAFRPDTGPSPVTNDASALAPGSRDVVAALERCAATAVRPPTEPFLRETRPGCGFGRAERDQRVGV